MGSELEIVSVAWGMEFSALHARAAGMPKARVAAKERILILMLKEVWKRKSEAFSE